MTPKRILLIEDEALVAQALAEILRDELYEVDLAENGVQGLKLFDSRPYDLILIDIFMPEKDGIATIMDLQKRAMGLKLIAMSGGGAVIKNFDYLEYAKALGVLACFQKPVNPAELLRVIAQHI